MHWGSINSLQYVNYLGVCLDRDYIETTNIGINTKTKQNIKNIKFFATSMSDGSNKNVVLYSSAK